MKYLTNQERVAYWENIGPRCRQYRGPYRKDRGPVFSKYSSEPTWFIREYLLYTSERDCYRHNRKADWIKMGL